MKILDLHCSCYGHHSIKVTRWGDGSADDDLMVSFIGEPSSLLEMIQWWWNHRMVWFCDVILSKEDVLKLIEELKNPAMDDDTPYDEKH